MIFFSVLGKFGAVFASIPAPIVAALYCLFFAYVASSNLVLHQESFKYVSDAALRRDNSGSEIAVPFEFSSLKGTNSGVAMELSNANFFGTTVSPLINTSGSEEINYRFLEEPTLDLVQESTFSAFPHNFTSMLSDAFRDQQEVNLINSCYNDKPKALEASHLKFPMVGCMGSSSFYGGIVGS